MSVQNILFLTTIILATAFTISAFLPPEGDVSTNATLQAENEITPRIGEEIIIQVFETLREKIKEGINFWGIHIPLDPIKTPEFLCLPLLLPKNPIVQGFTLINNIMLEGLSGFELHDVKGSIFPAGVTIGLRFPYLRFSLNNYKTNLKIFEKVNLYSNKGSIDFKFNNFDILVEIRIGLIPKIQISKLILDVTLPQTESKITGLFNDERKSDIISRQMTDTLQTLAVEEHTRVNEILYDLIWKLIENVINPCLAKHKYEDLPGIISGEKKFCEEDPGEIIETLVRNIAEKLEIDENYNFAFPNFCS